MNLGEFDNKLQEECVMEVDIRKATDDDHKSFCHLFDEIDTLHRDNLPLIFNKPSAALFENAITILD
jgi:hypothetical protein